MKKVLYVLASALFLLGAASCEKKTVSSDGQSEEQAGKVKVIFDASSQQGGTKTSLSATDQVLWSAGDAVKIYAGDENEDFTITSGAGTTSGTFEGWVTTSFTAPYYAIYPATAAGGISGDNILFTIPATQTYAAGSFGNGSAIMAAYSASDKSLAFKNLVGIIDLKLTGEGTVTFLKLTSSANNICGKFSVDKTDPTATITAVSGAKSITLEGVSAITLSATATHVYIAVAPATFATNDLTVDMTSSDDKIFSTTIGNFTAARAGIKEVPVAVEFVEDKCGGTKPVYSTNVSDVCGNSYKTVVIGSQIWMAENMRCNQYSNSASATIDATLKGTTIGGTSSSDVFTPYYTASTIAGGGYLYNWAAAVGVANGTSQKSAFSGNRQGICPDGWHVPTDAEWDALRTQIETTDGKGSYTAGKYLKNETGWTAYGVVENLNCYGFAALPSGYANGSDVSSSGKVAYFWTATPYDYQRYAYNSFLSYQDYTLSDVYSQKYYGRSVRCLKN